MPTLKSEYKKHEKTLNLVLENPKWTEKDGHFYRVAKRHIEIMERIEEYISKGFSWGDSAPYFLIKN